MVGYGTRRRLARRPPVHLRLPQSTAPTLGFFTKKKDDAAGPAKEAPKPAAVHFERDLRKSQRFFEHADATAQARNFDYSIDNFVNGLRFDPDNLEKHQQLRETALRRKGAGGKPLGMLEKMKVKVGDGSSAVEKMLAREKVWAMDPGNAMLLLDAMQSALEAQQEADEAAEKSPPEEENVLHLNEVAFWMGEQCLGLLSASSDREKDTFMELVKNFKQIGGLNGFEKAVESCRHALRADPNHGDTAMLLKNLEAEFYNLKNTSTEKGGFRGNLADADKQAQDQAEKGTAGIGVDELIVTRTREWEDDRDNPDMINRLVEALLKKQEEGAEKRAVALMMHGFEVTKEYRYKVRAADIQMQLLARQVTEAKKRADAGAAADKEAYIKVKTQQLKFELAQYLERSREYPTDMKIRFELGKRQFKGQMFEDAIGSFQAAKSDPKSRAECNLYLGRCYSHKGWMDEAIESLEAAVQEYPFEDDNLGKEMRYELMLVLAKSAKHDNDAVKAEKAQKIGSQLLQMDISYRDIREKLDTIRALVKTLRG